MSDRELLIKELIVRDFNEILVNEFCTDWKEKRLYIELLVRATHFDYLLNYIQQKENIIKEAREYIEKLKNFKIKCVLLEEKELYVSENDFIKELLEILDKENSNGSN